MKNFVFTKEGRAWNEDRCYSCDNFAFVLDGATGLFNQKFSDMNTDAEWFSDWWREYLIDALKDMTKSIPEILVSGVEQEKAVFYKMAEGKEPVKDFPSACISIARRRNGLVEIYTLGDSPIVVQAKTNISILIADTLNNVNDDINNIIVRDLALKNNLSIIEAKAKFPQCVENGRKMKNQFGGYYILADDPNAIYYGVYKQIDEKLIKKVLIVTDGYSQIFDMFKKYTLEEFAERINSEKDAEEVYQEICEFQEKDPGGDLYIRFKKRDDATIAVLDFEN